MFPRNFGFRGPKECFLISIPPNLLKYAVYSFYGSFKPIFDLLTHFVLYLWRTMSFGRYVDCLYLLYVRYHTICSNYRAKIRVTHISAIRAISFLCLTQLSHKLIVNSIPPPPHTHVKPCCQRLFLVDSFIAPHCSSSLAGTLTLCASL